MAVVCLVLMGFFLFLARRYAQPKQTNDYSHKGVVKKWLFFGLYLLVSAVSAPWVLHGLALFGPVREAVQPAATVQLQELRTIIAKSETGPAPQGSYLEFVDERMADYRRLNPNHRTVANELDAEVKDVQTLLTVKSGYPELRAKIKDLGEKADGSVKDWNLLYVGQDLQELEKQKPVWTEKIVRMSETANSEKTVSINRAYRPAVTDAKGLTARLFELRGENVTAVSVGLLVLLQLIIVFSWIYVCVDRMRAPVGARNAGGNLTTWS